MIKWLRQRSNQSDTRPDKTLVLLAQKGDREAYGQLYLRYLDQIYRFVYFRVGQDESVAENITEIVFTKGWKKVHLLGVKREVHFMAWLYQIARNTLTDHFRRKHPVEVELDQEMAGSSDDPGALIDENDQQMELLKALESLSETQRDIVIMKHIDALSYAEIAKITGKNETALRAIASRAMKFLKQKLTNEK